MRAWRGCLACSPSSGHNRRLARTFRAILLGIPLVSGCSNQSPYPPFTRVPYERFSRAAVVAIAMREWRLFGSSVNDDDYAVPDKPERTEGLWQRVGEYWYAGMNPGSPESGWTGKHDGDGHEFAPEDDGGFAWSAAFVSYVMRIAGAGRAFPYAADHAFYINAAKRMHLGLDRGWLVTAERPTEYAPEPGDLICHGRGNFASLRYDDLPTAELFPSHCDIVVAGQRSGTISVIGGNVQDAPCSGDAGWQAGATGRRGAGSAADVDGGAAGARGGGGILNQAASVARCRPPACVKLGLAPRIVCRDDLVQILKMSPVSTDRRVGLKYGDLIPR